MESERASIPLGRNAEASIPRLVGDLGLCSPIDLDFRDHFCGARESSAARFSGVFGGAGGADVAPSFPVLGGELDGGVFHWLFDRLANGELNLRRGDGILR